MEELFAVSFLPTRQDNADYKAAACAAEAGPRFRMALHAAGFLLAAATAGFWALADRTISGSIACSLLMLAALCVAFYQDALRPMMARIRAQEDYDAHRERMIAQKIFFFSDFLRVQTDRYNADIPYRLLYRAYENTAVFLFYTGEDEIRYIPKRAMRPEECEALRKLLDETLRGRFQREDHREKRRT